jgi:hypothetical protein
MPGPSSPSPCRCDDLGGVYPTLTIGCIIFHMSKVVSASQGLAPLPTATPLKALIPSYSDPTSRLVASSTTLTVTLRSRTGSISLFLLARFHCREYLTELRPPCTGWRRMIGQVGGDVRVVARRSELRAGWSRWSCIVYFIRHNKLETQQVVGSITSCHIYS